MRVLTLIHAAAIAIVLLGLTVQPIGAQRGVSALFEELDDQIVTHVPRPYRAALRAEARVAENAITGEGRLPPNPCRALVILNVMDRQVARLADADRISERGETVIRGTIAEIERVALPPGPCSRG